MMALYLRPYPCCLELEARLPALPWGNRGLPGALPGALRASTATGALCVPGRFPLRGEGEREKRMGTAPIGPQGGSK